jgi:signal transduction histidine kinase
MVRCAFNSSGGVVSLEPAIATHLYRIAQESVSNAVKHGHARKVVITLSSGFRQLRLRVKDDGVGIPDKMPQEHGMGVQIMHYRARMPGSSAQPWRYGEILQAERWLHARFPSSRSKLPS